MEIPTPVCGLVRNDREFDKFQFVSLRNEAGMHNKEIDN